MCYLPFFVLLLPVPTYRNFVGSFFHGSFALWWTFGWNEYICGARAHWRVGSSLARYKWWHCETSSGEGERGDLVRRMWQSVR